MSFKRRPPMDTGRPASNEHRVNRRIRVPRVQVIDTEGVNRGEMDTDAAMRMAEEAGLDLVEINPNARPPVCKVMNYGQYKYTQKKNAKRAKGHQAKIKGVRLHPNTAEHDVQVALKRSTDFLEQGDKVLIAVWFKGREIAHKERGTEILNRFVEALKDISKIEQNVRMEGKRMILLVAPMTPEERNARKKQLLEAKEKAIADQIAKAKDEAARKAAAGAPAAAPAAAATPAAAAAPAAPKP
ncbi:MAG: translation initiation factor IF-3 [Planctomycetes bacterium]|nr:translation initiation factor IF-3 [Planctomycetota bacterium]